MCTLLSDEFSQCGINKFYLKLSDKEKICINCFEYSWFYSALGMSLLTLRYTAPVINETVTVMYTVYPIVYTWLYYVIDTHFTVFIGHFGHLEFVKFSMFSLGNLCVLSLLFVLSVVALLTIIFIFLSYFFHFSLVDPLENEMVHLKGLS